jgi:NADH-quinone oxidoreductase subunit H
MPEAESELVAGYHTEYSSMKLAMFFMAEYIAMFTVSSLCAVPRRLPGFRCRSRASRSRCAGGRVHAQGRCSCRVVWVRYAAAPRYDQLMDLGWKRLFPLALANVFITGLLVTFEVI